MALRKGPGSVSGGWDHTKVRLKGTNKKKQKKGCSEGSKLDPVFSGEKNDPNKSKKKKNPGERGKNMAGDTRRRAAAGGLCAIAGETADRWQKWPRKREKQLEKRNRRKRWTSGRNSVPSGQPTGLKVGSKRTASKPREKEKLCGKRTAVFGEKKWVKRKSP